MCVFFFSSRRRHTRSLCDWSSDVCSSDLDDGTVHTKKVSSSVDDYARAIVEGIRELFHETGVTGHDVNEVLHGTTVASNARSEERRVGKECKSGMTLYTKKKVSTEDLLTL